MGVGTCAGTRKKCSTPRLSSCGSCVLATHRCAARNAHVQAMEGGEQPVCTDNFQIAPFELDGKRNGLDGTGCLVRKNGSRVVIRQDKKRLFAAGFAGRVRRPQDADDGFVLHFLETRDDAKTDS